MATTRNFADVIRAKLKRDGELARDVECEACAIVAESFAYVPKLLLAMGELTAAEKRVAKSLALAIAHAIRERRAMN